MLLPAIPLDAAMTASEALVRLARNGLWEDPAHPAAAAWIEDHCAALAEAGTPITFDEAAKRLRRDASRTGVAIRRQWYGRILWYARPADFVLRQCLAAAPSLHVALALELREEDSRPAIPLASARQKGGDGVVLEQGLPVAVSLATAAAMPKPPRVTRSASGQSRGTGSKAVPESLQIRAWPLLDAPEHVAPQTPFEVTVGFAAEQQAGVAGGQIAFPVPPGADTVELTVELIADGVDAPEGWTRPLVVAVADPTAARATFTLVGRPPADTEPVHLTLIQVNYVLGGAVCGTASRPLEIRPLGYVPAPEAHGTAWLAQPVVTSVVTPEAAVQAADLTIDIAKPDGNPAGPGYVCRVRSPHLPHLADAEPVPIDFGDDAKTFAQFIVDVIRLNSKGVLTDNHVRSWGRRVGAKLPDSVIDALHEVWRITKPEPPTVMIVSAEPYVPWELALLEPPLDDKLPPYLGVQTLLGRWLRDGPLPPPPGEAPRPAPRRVRRPPSEPPGTIQVRHMAVMLGSYKFDSGQKPLPKAKEESDDLIKKYDAVGLPASEQALKQLLDAQLYRGTEEIGGPGVVHFAGHGDFNSTNPDASVMVFSDGTTIPSMIFDSANYGGDRQPLIFLNACMIGMGGSMLGIMGGFPGNCLRGGFGGVVGALWGVDDEVAKEIALEFWQRALPVDGSPPEPVAAVLRDLRAQYDPKAPVPTYLAYVYYGHPRLTLQRVN